MNNNSINNNKQTNFFSYILYLYNFLKSTKIKYLFFLNLKKISDKIYKTDKSNMNSFLN